ncbi:hypothetical protein [Streptomyces sp. NPDC002205]|uniref:hypothetical protein n=1 Tax=Streptomyces sp. NPDC002205 TaxID=3154411 RepID=UPI0033293D42
MYDVDTASVQAFFGIDVYRFVYLLGCGRGALEHLAQFVVADEVDVGLFQPVLGWI